MKNFVKAGVHWVVATTVCVALASTGSAGIVEYWDVAGDNVTFIELVETSTGVGGPMYGQPGADGDTLVAPGTGFLVQSAAGGVELVDGRLQLTIQAESGFVFDEINVMSLGSYFGVGNTALSMVNSFTTVENAGQFFSDGVTITNLGAGQGGWQGDYTISFPETDQITLTLNTQLLASSGINEAAFIEASAIHISVNAFAASVPEPTSIWWIAIAMLAIMRRRRSG